MANRPTGRAECKECARARWQRYRKNNPLDTGERTQDCPHCGNEFTYTKVTKRRVYCTERCRMAAADAAKAQRVSISARQCACGSTDVARVGKPVCPNCRKDKRDPVKMRLKERARTLRLYGLSTEQYDGLVAQQGGKCAVCQAAGSADSWHIDHDHACCPGKGSCGRCVRGLLCQNCNLLLGHANDDPTRLAQAIDYLKARRRLREVS